MRKNTPRYSHKPSTAVEIDQNIINRFGTGTQSYSMYPTVDRFIEAFDTETYITNAKNRKVGGIRRPLALYVHIPFCNSLCFYCNHNPVVTKNNTGIKKYINYLLREIKLQGLLFQDDPNVEQLYFGGGTPTLLSEDQLHRVLDEIHHHFILTKDGEHSIEIDPRLITNELMAGLKAMGFNTVILEATDFDYEVQQATHRIQPWLETLRAIETAQREGFQSISIKLFFGLPKQSTEKFDRTLLKIIHASPDRISLVNYVHSPEKFKSQRKIKPDDLPHAQTRLEIFQQAINRLSESGYIHIGINHFVKSKDALAIAQHQGRLYQNLQGYSTHMDSDLVGLGVSAIGSIGPAYSQNHHDLSQYYDKLKQNILPIMRGLELTADDLLRRLVMHTIVCNAVLLYESIETVFPVDFKRYFATELIELMEFEKSGLLKLNEEGITITPQGRLFMRSICTVFDKYLRSSNERRRQSSII